MHIKEEVVERHTLVDLFLLDGRKEQTDRTKTRGVTRPHGCFHVLIDALFQGHHKHSPQLFF